MTKTELARALTKANNGSPLIKLAKIAEFMGVKNAQRVKNTYLKDLERIGMCYFVPEVAEALKSKARIGGKDE